jgi:flagellar protein FliO/FliZ
MTPEPAATAAVVEGVSWIRIIFAFAIVTALLAALGYGLKYVHMRGLMLPGMTQRAKRLHIAETLAIDARRRLVIVRRDDTEHLLLLGTGQDLVVEANLKKPQNASDNA